VLMASCGVKVKNSHVVFKAEETLNFICFQHRCGCEENGQARELWES
jgi:hypothetical protein